MQVFFHFTCDEKTYPTNVRSSDKIRDAYQSIVSGVPHYYMKLKVKKMTVNGFEVDPDDNFLEANIKDNDRITVISEFKSHNLQGSSSGVISAVGDSSNMPQNKIHDSSISNPAPTLTIEKTSLSNAQTNANIPHIPSIPSVTTRPQEHYQNSHINNYNYSSYIPHSPSYSSREFQSSSYSSINNPTAIKVTQENNCSGGGKSSEDTKGLLLYYEAREANEEVKLISAGFMEKYADKFHVYDMTSGKIIGSYKVTLKSRGIYQFKLVTVRKINDFSSMFYDCQNLYKIEGNLDTSSGKDFSTMFNGCSGLRYIDGLRTWDMSKAKSFYRMFF